MKAVHDMPFGARLLEGGGAEFALWAPGAEPARLVLLDDGDATLVQAHAEPGGWWRIAVPHAGAGQRYQWQVQAPGGEALRVPDPASRFNPQGPHGASVVVDAGAFEWDNEWRGRPWHEVVLYELHVGCFTPAGTFAAAEAQLPALAQLGVTALQLMPLGEWGSGFGWGYDGVLPYAPHGAYGTPQELKHFVQAAHRLKLMVFVDVVYNHFGPDGNYLHAYAPGFFSQRHKTAWGPALNFDEGEAADVVREFFVHNALYWLEEFRIDGLRFDAVHAMVDERRPDIMEALSLRVREAFPDRHIHLVLENDCNDAARLAAPATPGRFEGQWNGDFHHTLHVQLTGEREGYYAEYDRPIDQLASVLSLGYAFEGDPHGADRRPAATALRLGSTVNFLGNHDQIGNRAFGERLAALVGDAAAMRLATALLLLGPATPMLFMGEEFAALTPFLYFAGWQGALADAVRQGRAEEFKHFPRYAQAAAQGEIPDPCSEATFRRCKLDWASVHSAAHREWRRFCSELLLLRQRELVPHLPALAAAGHESWRIEGTGLGVRWRFDGGRVLQMLCNLGRLPVRLDVAPGPAPLKDTSRLYSVGEAIGKTLGKSAGIWQWGHES